MLYILIRGLLGMRTCKPAFFLFWILAYAASLPTDIEKTNYETEIKKSACELENNQTLRTKFQTWVRLQYNGIAQNRLITNRYNLMRINTPSSTKCYDVCPDSSPSDVTWCVHVYHPTENVTLCLNKMGIINETAVAGALELRSKFSVKQCAQPSTSPSCLWTTNTPYILNRAYLVCTSTTSTCVRRSFVDNIVDASKPQVEITHFPTTVDFALGQTITLKCSGTASSSVAYIEWKKDSSLSYYPIHEDPYCSAGYRCIVDTAPDARKAKLQRVRQYTLYESDAQCGEDLMNMTSYLVIDNAVEADKGNYTCSAETLLLFQNVKDSETLDLGST